MPKLILRSNYFKNEPANHKSNYIKYLGTREGVEMNPETMPRFFYEDLNMHGRKENYMEYISDRPGVVPVDGTPHGLFSDRGMDINLEQVMGEVANHPGTVWINVISLKREDASRLGFDNVERWQQLLRSHYADISEAFKIEPSHMNWYAAFHNEGHHPHVHMVVYSKGKNGYDSGHEGYLTRKAINKLKASLLKDIFKDELTNLYTQKSDQRQMVKEQAQRSLLFSLRKLGTRGDGIGKNESDEKIEMMLQSLGKNLSGIKGKKVYGYLHKNIKNQVDAILSEIENIPEVKEAYEKWCEYQKAIGSYYRDDVAGISSLSQNKEFKSIKNMIIQIAIEFEKASVMSQSVNQSENQAGENGEENVMAVTKLLKNLENMFSAKVGLGQSNSPVTDTKVKQNEKELKVARGQRADDHEVSENRTYMTMG